MNKFLQKMKLKRRWKVFLAANHFYGNPSKKIKIIGVTGTNGKTTTATLLHQLFRNLGYKAGMIGTVVNKINDESFDTVNTTPGPIVLNDLLSKMVEAGCEYCFMEVSSHAMDQGRVAGLIFRGGVFTNLTHDHMDYHKNFENYFRAKKKFFKMLPRNAFALTNIDDKYGQKMLEGVKAKKYFYSLKNKADFTGHLDTKLIGEFNAYNVLAIYATAVLLGQDKEKVKEEIKKLDPAPGRFVSITSPTGVIGIVDYAHTPDALENVLKTVNSMKGKGKVISLFGCGGDRDKTKRPIMARLGYDMSDVVILTSDNPRTEKPDNILEDMKKGIESLPQEKVQVISDRRDAIKKAVSLANTGDYILIAGKGHENYQEVNGVKNHFDDMEELKKCFNI
ncbi:MAG: UDP-N-acetylmuramoyl-L-alanyl-D-glutamate--2,6-diaminopimelate ligase [Patescibacteria group bacterium]